MYFLKSKKIKLSLLEKEDEFERTHYYLNNKETTKYTSHGIQFIGINEVIEYTEKQSNTGMHYAIYDFYDIHIGNINLKNINQTFRTAEISILIWESGKGYATEAIRLIIDHAFNKMNLNRIQAGTACKNIACIKAFEKNGFTQEAIIRQFYYFDCDYQDVVLLRLLKEEFVNGI